jgi:hypothetical protein
MQCHWRECQQSHISATFPNRRDAPKIRVSPAMQQVVIRRNGPYSLYIRIPPALVHANKLKEKDLAYLVPIVGRPDKFEVALVKAPVPRELQKAAAIEAAE